MEDDFNDFSELSAGDTSIALRRCFAQVAAERDQLRAEVEDIRQQRDYWQEEAVEMRRYKEASESLVAGLRGALEDAGDVVHACVCETEEIRGKVCHSSCIAIDAAISLTPASAGNRIKAEALREAAQRILNDPRRWPTVIANHIVHDLCAEADRMEKEGANG